MRKELFTAAIAAAVATAPITANAADPGTVYVWDQTGDVNIYDGIPAVSLPDSYHVEVVTGIALDVDGNGQILTSSDGPIDCDYNYYCYIVATKGLRYF